MSDQCSFNVFIKPGCPWCIEVTDYLSQHGYPFEVIDVVADPEAFAEMERLSGQTKAPTMTAGDLLLADFGVEELIPFLEAQEEKKREGR